MTAASRYKLGIFSVLVAVHADQLDTLRGTSNGDIDT